MESKIKVLLVDDHEMVRMGLAAYIMTDDEIEIVGEANNGKQGYEMAMEHEPDVILMDLVMDEMNGIEATEKITESFKEKGREVKIIILTSFIEEDKVMPAIEAGAFSFLLKSTRAEDILRAVKKAYRGESVIEGKVSQVMMKFNQRKPPKFVSLTERELEVLLELGKGMTNKEISETLYIGVKTVKTHISNILAKLELEDRTKAAVYANHNPIEEELEKRKKKEHG